MEYSDAAIIANYTDCNGRSEAEDARQMARDDPTWRDEGGWNVEARVAQLCYEEEEEQAVQVECCA